MRRHVLLCLVAATVACGGSPMTPSQAAVEVRLSPNPIAGPSTNVNFIYHIEFQETAGLGARLDRDENVISDATGHVITRGVGYLSKSAGCADCASDRHIAGGTTFNLGTFTTSWSIMGGAFHPATFTYTLFYTDDKGNALSSSAQVSVQ